MKPIRRCTLLKPPKVAVLSSRDLSASAEVRSVACTRALSLTAPAQRLTFVAPLVVDEWMRGADPLAIWPADTLPVAVLGVGGLVAVTTILCREGFVFSGFDPDGARVQGLPVRLLELLLVGLITLEVGVTTRALGALPVFGFSVLPGVAALLSLIHI